MTLLRSMEDDLEAGFGTVSGVGSLNGSFVVRLSQETSDEVRPLIYDRVENGEISPEHVFQVHFAEKHVKDGNKSKRPCKPPRHPKGPTLDAYDLKLIREISALALERRIRIERVKDLKKKRASKAAAASSNSTYISLIFTLIFCAVIVFQGVCSRNTGSAMKLQTSSAAVLSPSESVQELLSVQVFKNLPLKDYDSRSKAEFQRNAQQEMLDVI